MARKTKRQFRYTLSYWDREGEHPHFAGAQDGFANACARLDQLYQQGAVRVCLVDNDDHQIVYERRQLDAIARPTPRKRLSDLAECAPARELALRYSCAVSNG